MYFLYVVRLRALASLTSAGSAPSPHCCDPGAYCDLTAAFPQCRQPAQNSGMCRKPKGF